MLPIIPVKCTALSHRISQENQPGSLIPADNRSLKVKSPQIRKGSATIADIKSLQTDSFSKKTPDSLEISFHSLPSAINFRKYSRRMNAHSSPGIFLPQRYSSQNLALEKPHSCEDRHHIANHGCSSKNLQRSAPSTPHDRSPRQRNFPSDPILPLQMHKAAHKSMQTAICFGVSELLQHADSVASSCLSSSDTVRGRGISSSPATPRGRSSGFKRENFSQPGGSDEVTVGIADALRGKLERVLSASLLEVLSRGFSRSFC